MERGWPLTIFVAACGFSATPIPDAVTNMEIFQISGKASSVDVNGQTPLTNATIAAYRDMRVAPVASTSSTDQGTFTIAILVGDGPVDYIQATAMGYKDTYLYPATPLVADFTTADPVLLTPNTFDLVDSLASVTQAPGKGWIALEIMDENMIPIEGAVAEVNGGDIRYNGSNGLPTSGTMATQIDGIAYVFNAPLGQVSVSATRQGMPLRANTIYVRPDLVTMAYVTP